MPLGNGHEHHHRGLVNGVVTTLVPTLVTGTGYSNHLVTLPTNYLPHETKSPPSHNLPQVEFPEFDGIAPKSWFRNYTSYFEIYVVPEHLKVKMASMHFTGTAFLWS